MKKTICKSLAFVAIGALVSLTPCTSQAMLVSDYVGDDLVDKFVDWGIDRYDVNDDQTADEMWVPHAVGSTTTLVFAENQASAQEFGIYNSYGTQVIIFDGLQTVPTSVTATWWGNDLIVGGTTYTDFGQPFGFYLDSGYTANDLTQDVIYTQEALNNGEEDFFATYRGDGGLIDFDEDGNGSQFGVDDWIIAAEWTHHAVGGYDADDFVVFVSEMQPVPEPATMLLFGTGLAGFAAMRRRKRNA